MFNRAVSEKLRPGTWVEIDDLDLSDSVVCGHRQANATSLPGSASGGSRDALMRFSSCCLVRKDEYGEREPVVWAEQPLVANWLIWRSACATSRCIRIAGALTRGSASPLQ